MKTVKNILVALAFLIGVPMMGLAPANATQILLNNVRTKLTAAIGTSDTSIAVTTGTGVQFALATGGNTIRATLVKVSGFKEIAWEIVDVTARSSDTLTITRARESTTALTFAVNDVLDVRFTAGMSLAALTGPAATATALAANGANCSAGSAPLGVDASGASESCFVVPPVASPTFTGTVTLPILVSTDTTDAASSTTGAMKTAGGLGVAKKLYVGTSINAASASLLALANTGYRVSSTDGTTFSGIMFNTGDVQFTVGTTTNHRLALFTNNSEKLGIAAGGDITTISATDATSSSAASVMLTGGLAVAKKINAGDVITATGYKIGSGHDTATAWTAYTPTVTAGSGSFTTASATGRYQQIGKTVRFTAVVTLTTIGSGGATVNATLPVTAFATNGVTCAGRESGVTGNALFAYNSSTTVLSILKYDATFLGANGYVYNVNCSYEAS